MQKHNTQKSSRDKFSFLNKNYLASFSKAILNLEQNRLEEATMAYKRGQWPLSQASGLSNGHR